MLCCQEQRHIPLLPSYCPHHPDVKLMVTVMVMDDNDDDNDTTRDWLSWDYDVALVTTSNIEPLFINVDSVTHILNIAR